ncbi:MAG TPA: alpha/beta fold hydrolase, partial [Gemmatimonadales bacterium]|nr:alpha/beta fold hydrolase [Gemmatimonadales bacterium]
VEHLGIRRIALATGGSLGGMVALQWGRISPVPVDRLVVFAAPAATSAQAIGWNTAQRMAIEADPAWQGGRYPEGHGPAAGLAAARAIAMITYRSAAEFHARFGRGSTRQPGRFDAEQYLRRQGDKLVARFDAASYVALTWAMDLHDVGDPAAAARDTAARVGDVVGVGIDSDILYYPAEVRAWVDTYRAAGAPARYVEIASLYGHDAFLIEWGQVAAILAGTQREQ